MNHAADEKGMGGWRCSGALISPTVFLTAGHCTWDDYYNNTNADVARVWFDWDLADLSRPYLDPKGHKYYVGTLVTNQLYPLGSGKNGLVGFDTHDVGLILLNEPVTNVGFASLPGYGLVDTLPMRTEVTIVGYGVQEKLQMSGNPYYRWAGLRMCFVAPSLLIQSNDRISGEYLKLTANSAEGKGGTCFGDSGGPILYSLDGTYVVLGVNSFVGALGAGRASLRMTCRYGVDRRPRPGVALFFVGARSLMMSIQIDKYRSDG